MKKQLNYKEALKVLERGNAVLCQLSNREDNTEIVTQKERLNYLYNLSKEDVQMCKMYLISTYKAKIPENAIQISFDEAYEMVYNGDIIYHKENGKEKKITTPKELINTRKRLERSRQMLVLYRRE